MNKTAPCPGSEIQAKDTETTTVFHVITSNVFAGLMILQASGMPPPSEYMKENKNRHTSDFWIRFILLFTSCTHSGFQ